MTLRGGGLFYVSQLTNRFIDENMNFDIEGKVFFSGASKKILSYN